MGLIMTHSRNRGGARLVAKNVVEAARDILEIEGDIEIKWSNGRRKRGHYRLRRRQSSFTGQIYSEVHLITLSTYRSASQVSKTLWHELTHAHQVERAGVEEYASSYDRETRSRGYRSNTFEVEARDIAEAFTDDLPLAR